MQKQSYVEVPFVSYDESVARLLDGLAAAPVLARQQRILIKPNLVNDSPPPVTTPVECCEAIISYIRGCSSASIVIAEGCGAADYDTDRVFARLGYDELSKRLGIPLVDLNHAPVRKTTRRDCPVFAEMHLPEIAFDSYIISVPVLKAHSLATTSGALKNMMGLAPPAYYQQGGHWKKSAFHRHVHQAIVDLNRHLKPSLSILDARIGLAEYHLGGAECDPPVKVLLGGYDPVGVDRRAAELLRLDWRAIPHLRDCL